MSNPMKAEAVVDLEDGRQLTFVYDVNAWIDIGEEIGRMMGREADVELPEILKAMNDEDNPPGLKFQRVLVWGGLRKHHPEMSVHDAGAIMIEAAPAMQRAITAGMPQGGEGEPADGEPGPRQRKAGRGTVSATAGAGSA